MKDNSSSNYEYIGTLAKVKGFRGDIVLKDMQKGIKTISPGADIKVGYSLSFAESQILERFSLRSSSPTIAFRGIDDETKAERFVEKAAFTLRENINTETKDRPSLTEDIIGTEVFLKDNDEPVGTIVDLIYTPANEVWLIEREGKSDMPLPAVPEFIIEHNISQKKVWVKIPDGLEDL